jgi:DHA1 family bicyclomycin/chloramphenicol resistance-like MFS transporter
MTSISDNHAYKKILIILLLVLLFITQAATDIYIPALPVMAHEFGVTAHEMNMTITYYVYAQAALFLCVGQISDLIGRKKTIVFALMVTLICTFLISESKSLNSILVLRVFQAFGSAGVYIVSRLILKEVYNKDELLHVTGLFMLGLVLSPALAPVVGAFILKYLDWRWVFRILGISVAIFWVACIIILKETNHKMHENIRDFHITKLIHGYVHVLKDWLFIRYVLVVGGTFASFYAFITMSSYMYIQEYHISEVYYSYLFTFIAFGYLIGNKIMSKLSKLKYSPHTIVGVGISIGFVVCLLSILAFFLTKQVVVFIALVTLSGWLARLATAFINPPIQVGVLHAFPDYSSYAVGLLSSLQYVFAALGSWSVGALDMKPSESIIITMVIYTILSMVVFKLISKKDFV